MKRRPTDGWAFYYFLLAYFSFVASPPRMCRWALLVSRTFLTCRYSGLLQQGNRRDRSLWTVDLEIPKCCAAARTVAPVSIMYTASSQALCSIKSAIQYLLAVLYRFNLCAEGRWYASLTRFWISCKINKKREGKLRHDLL